MYEENDYPKSKLMYICYKIFLFCLDQACDYYTLSNHFWEAFSLVGNETGTVLGILDHEDDKINIITTIEGCNFWDLGQNSYVWNTDN